MFLVGAVHLRLLACPTDVKIYIGTLLYLFRTDARRCLAIIIVQFLVKCTQKFMDNMTTVTGKPLNIDKIFYVKE